MYTSKRSSVITMRSKVTRENYTAFFEMWCIKTVLQNNFYCSKFYQKLVIKILIKACQKLKSFDLIYYNLLQYLLLYIYFNTNWIWSKLCMNFALQIINCGTTGFNLGSKYHHITDYFFHCIHLSKVWIYILQKYKNKIKLELNFFNE